MLAALAGRQPGHPERRMFGGGRMQDLNFKVPFAPYELASLVRDHAPGPMPISLPAPPPPRSSPPCPRITTTAAPASSPISMIPNMIASINSPPKARSFPKSSPTAWLITTSLLIISHASSTSQLTPSGSPDPANCTSVNIKTSLPLPFSRLVYTPSRGRPCLVITNVLPPCASRRITLFYTG